MSASRITIRLHDDPDEHQIMLDGQSWGEVESLQVEIGTPTLVESIGHIPVLTIRSDLSDSFRLVGRCRPVTGLPPNRLVEVLCTFGHLPDPQNRDGGERAALYIDGHRVSFTGMRAYVSGGQQLFLEVDRTRDDLPRDRGGAHRQEWLSMFLVRGQAGTDLPPFKIPDPTADDPPDIASSANWSGYQTQQDEERERAEVEASLGVLPGGRP